MLQFDNAAKKPTNLSLNSKVLEMARELGMNLSQTVDALLAEEVRRRYWERWNAENREAVSAYNARIEKHGLPLARYRSFLKSVPRPVEPAVPRGDPGSPAKPVLPRSR